MTKIAAVVAGLLLVLVGAYTGEAASPAGAVFTAIVQDVDESVSDRVITIKQIRDRHGDVVGWGNTVCVRLGNGSSQCLGTIVLPKGKVTLSGTRHSSDFFAFAVTGGTGIYHGYGGSMVGRTIDQNPRREKLVFSFIRP